MTWEESEWLSLSGIQHFAFCRRQWALIHLEQQWQDNSLTAEGDLLHTRAHQDTLRERRGDTLTVRGMAVHSRNMGLTGKCDVVEFQLAQTGVTLPGENGLWQPCPVEYKHGKPKEGQEDLLQLCAQALCLEEMLCCDIPGGCLYYGQTRRRLPVLFTPQLRGEVGAMVQEMHEIWRRGHTPKAKPAKKCAACSLREICLPQLARTGPVVEYIAHYTQEVEE